MIFDADSVRVIGGQLDRDWLDYAVGIGGLVALVIAILALVYAIRADQSASRSAAASERSAKAAEASAEASTEQAQLTREISEHQRATVDELRNLFAEASRERAAAAERQREDRLQRLAEIMADFVATHPVLLDNMPRLRAHKLRIHAAIAAEPSKFQACAQLLRGDTGTHIRLPSHGEVQAADAEVTRELRELWQRQSVSQ